MRYVMRIAEFSESSNLWTQIALSGQTWEHTSLSIGSNLNLDCVVSYYEAMLARKMRVLAISFLEKTPSLFKCIEFFPTHLEHQQVSGGGRKRSVCGLRIWEAKAHLFNFILAQMNPLCVGRSKPRCVTQMNPLCVGRSKSQHVCTQPHVCICKSTTTSPNASTLRGTK